eukprot:c22464_g1_i1 orf=129-302(+)
MDQKCNRVWKRNDNPRLSVWLLEVSRLQNLISVASMAVNNSLVKHFKMRFLISHAAT